MWTAFATPIVLLLVGTVFFQRRRKAGVPAAADANPSLQPSLGYQIPAGYRFHLGHTWVAPQGRDLARVGIDGFAASLMGTVEKVSVTGEQRWVRQGQKLITLTCEGETVEMLSPLEGVVGTINPEVIKDPGLVLRDPYQAGWICAIKSADMESNLHNLLQGEMAVNWMQNCLERLKAVLAKAEPGREPDGSESEGVALSRLDPEMRRLVVNEFFLR